MIEGDWRALREQIMAEIKDKAPLIALATVELRREVEALGEKRFTVFDLGVIATIFVNQIIGNIEDRIKEMQEENER